MLFICSSIGGHLGCFHFLAIIDNAAMDVCIQLEYLGVFRYLGYKPRSGIAGSDVNSVFIGFRNCQTDSLILHSCQHCLEYCSFSIASPRITIFLCLFVFSPRFMEV